jgi:hypothetical protein
MLNRVRYLCLPLASVLALLLAACSSQNPSANENPNAGEKPGAIAQIFETTKPITIAAGTPISVVLDQSLSSAENRPGDRFQASVFEPVVVDGKTIIPKNARVEGRIVDARAGGHLHGVARLELALESVEVGGKSYPIATSETTRVGHNHNKRNLVLIGGGSGVGALIGGLAGGGTGALIGAGAGAGAGTVGAAFTGKKNIRVPAETRMTFRLRQSVTIPVKS